MKKEEVNVESHNAREEVSELMAGNLNSGLSKSLDPVYRIIKEETLSPRGQLLNLRVGNYTDLVYKSTLCMAAEQKSLSKIQFSRIMRKARKVLVEEGREPESAKAILIQLQEYLKD